MASIDSTVGPNGQSQPPLNITTSPRVPVNGHGGTRNGQSSENNSMSSGGILERQPSVSYSHHRQTSIVHGIQHSRNSSLAQPPALPAWAPQLIAAQENAIQGAIEKGELRSPFTEHSDMPISPMSFASQAASMNATLQGFGHNASQMNLIPLGSTLLTDRPVDLASTGTKRGDKTHGKSNHRHGHNMSASKGSQPELKTVGEYSLHVLFQTFVEQAERKISECLSKAADYEPQVELICGVGVDASFDQLIGALAHIARQKPKPLIDSMMFWRKAKADAAISARSEFVTFKQQTPSNFSFASRRTADSQSTLVEQSYANSSALKELDEKLIIADRRSTISIYILCRVLIKVIGQSSLSAITPDMAVKLEDIIFSQLCQSDAQSLNMSPLRLSNWTLFAQLLGIMANLNFENVSDRFFQELERIQREYAVKGSVNKSLEGSMELVVRGMGYLQLKMFPDEAWEQSCDFLLAFGKFFNAAQGQHIKHTYCQVLEKFLLPIAAKGNLELNTHKWKSVVEILTAKVSQMMLKPRHWNDAFPLMAILISVSPTEVFSQQWMQFITPLQAKLKDRLTRSAALQAICRLVWAYLYRCPETLNTTVRKLDEIIKLVFPTGKKNYLSTEMAIAEPMIQLIRIIGYKHQDLAFRTIIFPLLNSELFTSGKELRVEQLDPEKIVIAIKAFLAIMGDLERGHEGRPPYPKSQADIFAVEKIPSSPQVVQPKASRSKQSISKLREERLSKPVMTAAFGEVAKEYYVRFCEILGKITLICDNAFGGQAALDERFNNVPKTPISESFGFSRRDDHQSAAEQKQGFYDLLHVAVQALPRCLSSHINFNALVNLLCTATAHVQSNIAISSAQSLKSIARQSHAQQVTIGFARFLFSLDNQYSAMSDSGMLGPVHIENTLKLYVELLQIWIEEIKRKSLEASASSEEAPGRAAQLDLSGVLAYVDDIESHGLFFLCSQSRTVRTFAIVVLKLIVEFDTALGKHNNRVIHVLQEDATLVMDLNDEQLTVAERSRLQQQGGEKGSEKKASKSALIELSSSTNSYDTTLWYKIFPNLMRLCFDRAPNAVALCRELVCTRLLQMQKLILASTDITRLPQYAALDLMGTRPTRQVSGLPDGLIEQWKLYLIVACTTLTNTDTNVKPAPSQQAAPQHTRKASKFAVTLPQDRITSARSLFNTIIPLMAAQSASIRDSVVMALGSININIYKTLLESLHSAVAKCNEEARIFMHQRTTSSPQRSRRTDRLRTEITHVYKRTSHLLQNERIYQDDWILNNLVNYTKELKRFLSDPEIQANRDFQRLRRHYCGLMEALFEGINRTPNPDRWIPFDSRQSSFALMEDWCGYSPNQAQIQQREDSLRPSLLDQQKEYGATNTAAMEIEKRNLKEAALSAMASLCAGPIIHTTEHVTQQFDLRRLLSWIDTIFMTPSDKVHKIGHRALKNLIIHNEGQKYLVEWPIHMLYNASSAKALESYLDVVVEILVERKDYPVAFSKIISAGLFTLGDELSVIRSKAAFMLKSLEEKQSKSSKIQDFDISVADKTTAVYKLAQFEISKRLAANHSELAFYIFSEFSMYFKDLPPHKQRNMVAALLPWIQTMQLKVDPSGAQTAESYMLLANLFEITIRSGNALHNEIQALWQALATGPYVNNVQLILDYIISICLARREQNFVDYAKQIVVFLSNTPHGYMVIELLLSQIGPRAMVLEKREPEQPPPEVNNFPYTADLNLAVPLGGKQAGYSLGQLALIFLVDLMVGTVKISPESVPLLLQIVFTLWDHYTPLVQDHAREMLIHLIHELVISKIDESSTDPSKKHIQDLIDSIRRHEPQTQWAYEEDGSDNDSGLKVPASLEYLSNEVVDLFTLAYPSFKEQWGRTTLNWATQCPVRHLACRSFQVFRCISTSLDQGMLSDMLARLSNTVAEDQSDYQTFSMEILTTLKTLIRDLSAEDLLEYPQLFWTAYACLDTIHEAEFAECLHMLEELLQKLPLGDEETVAKLMAAFPVKWEGDLEAIPDLLYKGIRSSACSEKTLGILGMLIKIPNNELVGDDSRLLFAVLGNLPRFLNSMDQPTPQIECTSCAEELSAIADAQGRAHISRALNGFANSRYRTSKDFVSQTLSAIREAFFPAWDVKCLVFLLGMLSNSTPWFKVKTMQILCIIIPEIDMSKSAIAKHGPDLISPLLRLLQTEYCPQALEVLDQMVTMPATPMDRQTLRMSMIGSHNRALRKEFERTETLFGIPDESGWSIPMPAIHSQSTRNNVQRVFHTCVSTAQSDPELAATPEVEFHLDDFQYPYPAYTDHNGTMTSESRPEANMGELVMALHSLDQEFDVGPALSTENLQSPSHIGTYGPETPHDYAAAVAAYEQALPSFKRTLSRAPSVSSFQSGYTEQRYVQPRELVSPASYNAGQNPSAYPWPKKQAPVPLASAIPFQTATGVEFLSDDEDDFFPDESEETTPRKSSERQETGSSDLVMRPPVLGLKTTVRRLTGGNSKEKERERDILRAQAAAAGRIPKSPQVPESYLKTVSMEKSLSSM
jgi:hypothetical protein